jgi:acyl carrier protein
MANERFPFTVSPSSITMMVKGKTYTITQDSHPNYTKIREALKNKEYDVAKDLVDVAVSINNFGQGKITVQNGVIHYAGTPLHNALTSRVLQQMNEGFDVQPMLTFLENLMQNPSMRAVDELYGFLEQNSLPITEDGHFVAYKRVRDDYMDFYTGKMDNSVGKEVKMERNQVDDDKDRTCSKGLHFCSLEYLPHYYSNQGRIVIVKINPADVVSIPSDYNNAKGRACRYVVIEEYLGNQSNEKFKSSVYVTPAAPVAPADEDDNSWFGSQSCMTPAANVTQQVQPKATAQTAASIQLELRVKQVISDQLGMPISDINNTDSFIMDLGADSLDLVELVMALEDEFGIEVNDDEIAQNLNTVQQSIDFINSVVNPVTPPLGAHAPAGHPVQVGMSAAQAQTAVQATILPARVPATPVASTAVLYTVEQACQKLGISRDALRKRIARGTSVVGVMQNGVQMVKIL